MENNQPKWFGMSASAQPTENESKSSITKRIQDLIVWYNEISSRKEDDYIKANLQLINNLAENLESSEDLMFIEKITDTFCHILQKQREVVMALEDEANAGSNISRSDSVLSNPPIDGEYLNDEQIKATFYSYMHERNKSDFTINDYILRVKNLWRGFYADYQAGELPIELADSIVEDDIDLEHPLLNAYHYLDELNCYISMKIACDEENRNLANIRASLNKFGEAVQGDDYKKIKAARKENLKKDYSKYLFDGRTYGKSRLVLAVVEKYVKQHYNLNFADLENAFPPHLQGSLGVVRILDSVPEKYKGIGGVKRYFVKDNEIIHLPSGEKVTVSTQWGNNVDRFIDHAMNKLDYKISKA